MTTLNGQYYYDSFCTKPATTDTPAQIGARWAPHAPLDASTDATGKVSGTLTFAPGVVLNVSGSITPATADLPEGVDLTGTIGPAEYRIRGFFYAGFTGMLVAGVVVAVRNDLAKQPDGTVGAFTLVPVQG